MAIIKTLSRSLRSESLSRRVMVDTVRGVLRVRKWPKKRGTPTSERQLYWIDWFRQANKLTKYVDAASMRLAIRMTAGTGIYPRDILLKAMRGRLYTWTDQTGHRWHSMAAIQDISDSLDVLAQNIGSVLVRATDRWRAPAPGNFNDVMTYKSDTEPPVWQAPSVGGGVTQEALPGYPVIPDNTVNSYEFDVSDYSLLELTLDAIGFAAADSVRVRLSTDDGGSWHSGGSDYLRIYITASVDGRSFASDWGLSTGTASSGHYVLATFTNLRAGRASMVATISSSGSRGQVNNGAAIFDGPITNIQIRSTSGNNFNAGAIRLVGLR